MNRIENRRKPKGYSSSSHYRINSVAEKSEQVLAIKFVQWDVLPLESLCSSKVYLLRAKLNRGECMSREEKNWLCEAVNSNTYFRTAVPLHKLSRHQTLTFINHRTYAVMRGGAISFSVHRRCCVYFLLIHSDIFFMRPKIGVC